MFIVHSRRTSSSRLCALTVYGLRVYAVQRERAFNGRMNEWMDVRWVVDTQDVNNRAHSTISRWNVLDVESKTRKMNAFNDDDNVDNDMSCMCAIDSDVVSFSRK